jgi:hypothetical protein
VPPEKDEAAQAPTLEQSIDTAIADASPEGSPNKELATGGDDNGSTEDSAEAAAAAAGDDKPAADAGDGKDGDDTPGAGSEDPGAAAAGSGKPEGKGDDKGKPGADGSAAAKTDDAGKAKTDDDAGKPKQPDAINDPIPAELKGKTRERMTSLVDTAKTLTQELEESRGTVDTFLKAIEETGANPETFARHVEVLRLMNSQDPAEQRTALKALRGAADRLAKNLGEAEPGKELEGHADLLEEVEDGAITRARAIEIAAARNAKKAEDARAERLRQQNETESAEQQAVNTAKTELNALEVELRKADPDYDRKRAAIENAAKALMPTIHPTKWKAAYKRLYDTVDVTKLPRAAPRVGDGGKRNVPAGTGDRQPMRPKQGAGGGARKAPASLEEAIDFGIEQARGG